MKTLFYAGVAALCAVWSLVGLWLLSLACQDIRTQVRAWRAERVRFRDVEALARAKGATRASAVVPDSDDDTVLGIG